ncbi:L-type lectin-domain containing receptor kinase IX.1-like [Ziziphus jujuba]|uniref:L-type lectin-domain containing receptor kinase IX.1-like n=1 Tax=Ziziphus jujuba TaxID=326968 RepID=A0A6P4AEU0_ZIZJJ|nr:L-type lectin-domain containing receptor kinase IX.1-like [Ziziphus jujuba]
MSLILYTPRSNCLVGDGRLVNIVIVLVASFHSLFQLPIANSLNFNIAHFEPEATNIAYEGDAEPSSGAIRLNRMDYFMVGRATYSKPLHLWDSASGTLTDFTTRFSFTIDISSNATADGFAFFLAPMGYTIPPNSGGKYLALFNHTTGLATSSNQIVMVEFDTLPNVQDWDPPQQHVGININSISSVKYTKWDSNSHSGQMADVVISYSATTRNLSVSWEYRAEKQPVPSSVSHIIDLMEVLPEWVTIGFSAATGLDYERHTISSWEFTSSLDAKKLGRKKGVMRPHVIALIVVGAFFFMLLFGICIGRSVIWKMMSKRRWFADKPISVDWDLERGALPKRFSHQELVAATDGFADSKKLGQGGSGQVYKGTLNDLGRLVAVKRISTGSDNSERIFINEVKIISRLIHKNLVQFIGWCHEKDEFLLVYDYMHNGSLDTHLFGNKITLPWNARYKIALGLASATHYLHEDAEQCVLHRDIKSANVLLDTDFSTKLGDFGVAKLVDPRLRTQLTGVVGTYGYLAPEYVNGGKASKESDMYSFGVVALEIACGRRTYQNGEYHVPLMRWVWELYLAGNIMDAADERLNMDFDSNEMQRLMMVGLWCSHPSYRERPKAGQVIKVLELDMPLPELPCDMHDSLPPLPQQKANSIQSPITSTIYCDGR